MREVGERAPGPGFPVGFSATMEKPTVCLNTMTARAMEHLKCEGPNFSFHLVLIRWNLNSHMGWLFWQRTNRRSKGRRWEKSKTQVEKLRTVALRDSEGAWTPREGSSYHSGVYCEVSVTAALERPPQG